MDQRQLNLVLLHPAATGINGRKAFATGRTLGRKPSAFVEIAGTQSSAAVGISGNQPSVADRTAQRNLTYPGAVYALEKELEERMEHSEPSALDETWTRHPTYRC